MLPLLLSVFVFGFLMGGTSVLAYGAYRFNRYKKAKEKLTEKVKEMTKDLESKQESIKERLLKAADITKIQMELRSQQEMPSKNALHSRHKNGLVYEINDLEEQKLSILRSVLGDGFDPMITIINDGGGREEVPLSSYVDRAEKALFEQRGTTPPLPPEKKNVGKFVIYKGGKDDGKGH